MQLLMEKVFNLNETKETHKIQAQGLKAKHIYMFSVQPLTDNLWNIVPHNDSKRGLFIAG